MIINEIFVLLDSFFYAQYAVVLFFCRHTHNALDGNNWCDGKQTLVF